MHFCRSLRCLNKIMVVRGPAAGVGGHLESGSGGHQELPGDGYFDRGT